MSGIPQPGQATPLRSSAPASGHDGYVPGECNIGTWEIRRRRLFAVIGFAVAGAVLVGLLLAGAPAAARLILILPLWGGMFSWLQARRRFCAAFAMAGISNFGEGDGTRRAVVDPAAHHADMMATLRMTRDSFLLAVVPTIIVALLPV